MVCFILILQAIIEIFIAILFSLLLFIIVFYISEELIKPRWMKYKYNKGMDKWVKQRRAYVAQKLIKLREDEMRKKYPLLYWNKPLISEPREPIIPITHFDYDNIY